MHNAPRTELTAATTSLLADPMTTIMTPFSAHRGALRPPERVLSINGSVRPALLARTGTMQMEAIIEIGGNITPVSFDYTQIFDIAAARVAFNHMHVRGRNDPRPYKGTSIDVSFTKRFGWNPTNPAAPGFSQSNLFVGFAVKWTVAANNTGIGTFQQTVNTYNCFGEFGQPLNRSVEFQTAPSNRGGDDNNYTTPAPTSGTFALLFAQRLEATDTPGYGDPLRPGAMSLAIPQLMYLDDSTPSALNPKPTIEIIVDEAVYPYYSADVFMLTSAAYYTAMTRKACGVDIYPDTVDVLERMYAQKDASY
jgi:hypothetical protein